VYQLLLFPLEQVLDRDPRRPRNDLGHIFARHTISQHHPRRRLIRFTRLSTGVAGLLLEVRDDVVGESRGSFEVSVSLGDLEIDLGLFEFLHDSHDERKRDEKRRSQTNQKRERK
jgi:hypothetical protein